MADLGLGPEDCLIGLAASGKTPFTIAALRAARAAGCLTVGISNNSGAPLLEGADYPVCLATGAEALAGSTRLKAGTAQKICLNLISTQLMVLMGKVRHGLMAEMKPPAMPSCRRRHADIQGDAGFRDKPPQAVQSVHCQGYVFQFICGGYRQAG